MYQIEKGSYASPSCRVINVNMTTVLCGSVNSSPDILYNDDPFILS